MDRYRGPADLPAVIPVFPLRGAILLPRSEVPLNVFEPRYLEMIDDAMRDHRIIGVIQPAESHAPGESPAGKAVPLKRIGCAGRITAWQELPDGRLRIVLTGLVRFGVLREAASEKPYRLVAADFMEFARDFAPDDSTEGVNRDEFLRVLKGYLTARKLEADWNAITRAPLEPLINGLSSMSPFGPEEKQALLEARTLRERASVLVALAEMAIASGDATGGGGTLQ